MSSSTSKVHNLILQFETLTTSNTTAGGSLPTKKKPTFNRSKSIEATYKHINEEINKIEAQLDALMKCQKSDVLSSLELLDILIELNEIVDIDAGVQQKKIACFNDIKTLRERIKEGCDDSSTNELKSIIKSPLLLTLVPSEEKPLKHVLFQEENNQFIEPEEIITNEQQNHQQPSDDDTHLIGEIISELDYYQSLIKELNPFDVFRIATIKEGLESIQQRLKTIDDDRLAELQESIDGMFVLLNNYHDVNENDVQLFDTYANDMETDEVEANEKDFQLISYMDDLEMQMNTYKKLVTDLKTNEMNKANVLAETLNDIYDELMDFEPINNELIKRKACVIKLIQETKTMLDDKIKYI